MPRLMLISVLCVFSCFHGVFSLGVSLARVRFVTRDVSYRIAVGSFHLPVPLSRGGGGGLCSDLSARPLLRKLLLLIW